MQRKLPGFLVAAFVAAFSFSCASTHIYEGPVADRLVVKTDKMRHLDTMSNVVPQWKLITVLHVSNPSDKRSMNVLIDCDPTTQPGFKGDLPASGGTREHLTIPQRTTQDVLLSQTDASCLITEE